MVDAGIADILRYTSYICYVVAGLFLILSVTFFFTLKIRDVIYEFSGKARTASTKQMNESYAMTGTLRSSTMTDSFEKASSPRTGRTETVNIRQTGQSGKIKGSGNFRITKDVMVVHTNERIQ